MLKLPFVVVVVVADVVDAAQIVDWTRCGEDLAALIADVDVVLALARLRLPPAAAAVSSSETFSNSLSILLRGETCC